MHERHRAFEFTLEQIRMINHAMRTYWDRWVMNAPPSWKEDGFLQENVPVAITKRYGQNQKIAVPQADEQERNNWNSDRDFTHLRTVAFSIASHLQHVFLHFPLLTKTLT